MDFFYSYEACFKGEIVLPGTENIKETTLPTEPTIFFVNTTIQCLASCLRDANTAEAEEIKCLKEMLFRRAKIVAGLCEGGQENSEMGCVVRTLCDFFFFFFFFSL